MKLHAENRIFFMTDAHYEIRVGLAPRPAHKFKFRGDILQYQRMVAGGAKRRLEPCHKPNAAVVNWAGLAMHYFGGMIHG